MSRKQITADHWDVCTSIKELCDHWSLKVNDVFDDTEIEDRARELGMLDPPAPIDPSDNPHD